jgi:osmotically-inducible protein OsmY
MATMKKQSLAIIMALLVLLSMTAMATTGRYDQQIQQAASHKLQNDKHLHSVSTSVEDGIVTLSGTVSLYQDKLDAAKKVKKLPTTVSATTTMPSIMLR